MEEYLYTIEVDGEHVGECIPLEYATIFVEALFKKFYAMPGLKISIERMVFDTEEYNG